MKTITGWAGDAGDAGDAGERFHQWAAENVIMFEYWDLDAVDNILFSACEDDLNMGEDMTYEIRGFEVRSGVPNVLSFTESDFIIEDRRYA